MNSNTMNQQQQQHQHGSRRVVADLLDIQHANNSNNGTTTTTFEIHQKVNHALNNGSNSSSSTEINTPASIHGNVNRHNASSLANTFAPPPSSPRSTSASHGGSSDDDSTTSNDGSSRPLDLRGFLSPSSSISSIKTDDLLNDALFDADDVDVDVDIDDEDGLEWDTQQMGVTTTAHTEDSTTLASPTIGSTNVIETYDKPTTTPDCCFYETVVAPAGMALAKMVRADDTATTTTTSNNDGDKADIKMIGSTTTTAAPAAATSRMAGYEKTKRVATFSTPTLSKLEPPMAKNVYDDKTSNTGAGRIDENALAFALAAHKLGLDIAIEKWTPFSDFETNSSTSAPKNPFENMEANTATQQDSNVNNISTSSVKASGLLVDQGYSL